MLLKRPEYRRGYNAITVEESDALVDFGLIKLEKGDVYQSAPGKERAYMLLYGSVAFKWDGGSTVVSRHSSIEEYPITLSVCKQEHVEITCAENAEICACGIQNEVIFPAHVYMNDENQIDIFAPDAIKNVATRQVRTVLDATLTPHSNLVLGENITYPGSWSSFPPHFHPQPEIYHYRFSPAWGYGISEDGDIVEKVYTGDTTLLTPNNTHPQVAAPGYVMYYIWIIPQTEKCGRWLRSRTMTPEHEWLCAQDAAVWTPKW